MYSRRLKVFWNTYLNHLGTYMSKKKRNHIQTEIRDKICRMIIITIEWLLLLIAALEQILSLNYWILEISSEYVFF